VQTEEPAVRAESARSRWILAPVAADSSESIHAHVDVDDEDEDGEPAAVCMRWPGVETVDLSDRLRPDSSALLNKHITD
jgi:hypothetical protein